MWKQIEKKGNIILGIVIVLFFFVYLSLCFNNNIWTDEAFTVQLLQEDFLGVIKGTANDVHPPLYYLITKLFTVPFGNSLLVMKLAAIAPVILTMILGMTYVKKRFDFKTAFFYILMLGVIPVSMEYAVQIRMYSWAMLFVTLSAFSAYEIFCYEGKKKAWFTFVLSGIAAAYTHNFALAAVLVIYGFLFLAIVIKKRALLLKWFLSAVVSVIAFFPWLLVLMKQIGEVSKSYWIPPVTWETVADYFSLMFETSVPHSTVMFNLLFIAAGIALCMRIKREKNKESIFALLCLLVPLIVAFVGTVISLMMNPIFIARYIIPEIALASLFFGYAMSKFSDKLLLVLTIFLCLMGLEDYKDSYNQEYLIAKTPATEQFLEESLMENDKVIYNFQSYGFIYEYYIDEEQLCYIEDMDFNEEFDTVWFLNTFNYPVLTQEILDEHKLTQTLVGDYGIEQNNFQIWKIERNE